MSLTISPPKVVTAKSLRNTIKKDFPHVGDLPITVGWGYDLDSAIFINKNDPTVDPNVPFDGVAIEYTLAEFRIYEELIITP